MGIAQSSRAQQPGTVGGMYFGEKFTLANQEYPPLEAFLFGDTEDLSMIARVSGTVPQVPQNIRHTNTLRSLVNVHRDSITLTQHRENDEATDAYHVSFVMDADCPCVVTIYTFAEEIISSDGNIEFKKYKNSHCKYETEVIQPGFNISFGEPSFVIRRLAHESDLNHHVNGSRLLIPLVIQVTATSTQTQHCQTTYCSFVKSGSSCQLKVIAQKLHANGISYLLRDIYGLNEKADEEDEKAANEDADDDDDWSSDGQETNCVVCLFSPRDSLVLPCRHLCLCSVCADEIRQGANGQPNCPICRKPFHAILQLQAIREATEEEIEKHKQQEAGNDDADATKAVDLDEDDEIHMAEGLNGFRAIPLAQAATANSTTNPTKMALSNSSPPSPSSTVAMNVDRSPKKSIATATTITTATTASTTTTSSSSSSSTALPVPQSDGSSSSPRPQVSSTLQTSPRADRDAVVITVDRSNAQGATQVIDFGSAIGDDTV